jgi:uncharacterized protein (TIGR00299 family) protein
MTRVAWFQCSAGVAGDMVMSALVDAGADQLAVMDAIGALGVDGWALMFEEVQRCGVRARWANVVVHDHDHPHRPARDVIEMIERAALPDRVRDRAVAVYRALAEVEAAVHGTSPGEVELHEVGAIDSIIDVVGVCAALESLDIEMVTHSPIAVGHGTVTTAHGVFPNPVPAVTGLLERAGAPIVGVDTTMELSTPTGVALMTVLATASGSMPPMTVSATGFGAGSRDTPDRPNVVQVVIGESADAVSHGQLAHEVCTNVDDATGEVLAHTIERLLEVGAFDAWVTPIVMKKGRPAHTVHALCDDARRAEVIDVMLAETGSMGIRSHPVERWPQRRDEIMVDVDGHPVRVKIADHRIKVEFDDAARAAAALSVPVRQVLAAAEALAESNSRRS